MAERQSVTFKLTKRFDQMQPINELPTVIEQKFPNIFLED